MITDKLRRRRTPWRPPSATLTDGIVGNGYIRSRPLDRRGSYRCAAEVGPAYSSGLGSILGCLPRPRQLHNSSGPENLVATYRCFKDSAAGGAWAAFRVGVGTVQLLPQCLGLCRVLWCGLSIGAPASAGDVRLAFSYFDRYLHPPRYIRHALSVADFVPPLRWHPLGDGLVPGVDLRRSDAGVLDAMGQPHR